VLFSLSLNLGNNFDCQIISKDFQGTDTYSLIALNELYGFLQESRIKCNLVLFCKRADLIKGSNMVTKECSSDVFKKARQPFLCPMAQWIKTFGIYNIA